MEIGHHVIEIKLTMTSTTLKINNNYSTLSMYFVNHRLQHNQHN